jgi:type II secretory pathway pseudopilin PulG
MKNAGNKAYSLLEVIVSLAILLAGILTIVNYFPLSLKANNRAALLSDAALLAQMKAEEIRRDNIFGPKLLNLIRTLRKPTEPVQFAQNTLLAYSFCGVSLLDPVDDPDNTTDDVGVARIIVRYDKSYRPTEDVIYELRFDE